MGVHDSTLTAELELFVEQRSAEFERISEDRRVVLDAIVGFVTQQLADEKTARLVFICTHNSRRSHMAQLWAQVATHTCSVPGVETFSGGTETTAFNPRAVAALRRAGFRIEPFTDGVNPIYEVSFKKGMEPMQAFSKLTSDPPNPTGGFAAVMTCSAADAACPVVLGADERIAVTYDDPKNSDGTKREAAAYDERCAQIACEMLWVFSEVANNA